MHDNTEVTTASGIEIAIVGMAGRFPGADDVDAFWRNIRDGIESVTRFSDEALRARGVPEALLSNPDYVKAGVPFEGMDRFDASFFGYTPRDAERLDPQQRLFLECAWQALEHAGHDPRRCGGSVGVYAGSGAPLYLLKHLLPHQPLGREAQIADLLGLLGGNAVDSLCTRVAYKLGLQGPAVSVQTACSTSLMAVHVAGQALLNYECDMALAGGVSLNLLQDGGYRHQAGAIFSPDGHCRAFDHRAAGTVLGSGLGVVVLKRLADAQRDGDTVHAVIKGSAANNDGADKVGFAAPSVNGQARVIRSAQLVANVEADTFGYIEAHGTGTTLGDPIEVAALTQAFRVDTARRGFCAIGSVKTNVGHLDAAAGVAGLIKAVMALRHRTLPASLHFERPNPQIAFDRSPFYVNTQTRPWEAKAHPRRAGVSSFGIGGSNVHVVLEEAAMPATAHAPQDMPVVLALSARSVSALQQSRERLAAHLRDYPELPLADVAHTLAVGRVRFAHRAGVQASSREEAIDALAQGGTQGKTLSDAAGVAFLFPGQGAQHVQMARGLYEREPVFREIVDRCCERLALPLGLDLRALLFPAASQEADARQRLDQTALTQPALFVVEYAMARLWMHWGVQPEALLGHSIGEYVAACLAGVFLLDDALDLVVARGRLLQALPPGAMLAVSLPEAAVRAELPDDCDVAAVNAADACVLSGPVASIERMEQQLCERGVAVRALHVSHAFHSSMVEPVLADFEALVARVPRRAPGIPFVSNVTGEWITADEATSPSYWTRHVRGTVRFAQGLQTLFAKADRVLLEVGPGETLSALARRHPNAGAMRPILASQCHANRADQNGAQPARCLAQLWVAGIEPEARAFCGDARRRVPLPTYPFERQSYWMSTPAVPAPHAAPSTGSFYWPAWRREPLPTVTAARTGTVVLLADASSLADELARHFARSGRTVAHVEAGASYERLSERHFRVRPGERGDIEQTLREVAATHGPVSDICHLWSLKAPADALDDGLARGFHSLLALTQALHATTPARVALTVVTSGSEDVTGTESLHPLNATLRGPCKVIPQEFPQIACRLVDVVAAESTPVRLAQQIAGEMAGEGDEAAYRGPHRWLRRFEPMPAEASHASRLRQGGVYAITGGLGGVGLVLARHLARRWQARLVLIGRSTAPADAVRELENRGAQVLTLQADVSDADQLTGAIADTRRCFGRIDGVIHAAGVPGGGLIAGRHRDDIMRVFAPKLQGALNLLQALRGEEPDFIVLCSSLTAVTGGIGQVDYAAANAFLDTIATQAWREGLPVHAVNWDTWRRTGMAAAQQLPEGFGIAPEEGGELLEALLSGPARAQTLISKIPLAQQFEAARSLDLAQRLVREAVAPAAARQRPELSTPYVKPEGELEEALTALWTEHLGFTPIGAHDNLFELGGDSLLAIRLLAQVRSRYGIELHPADFFNAPTVAALALFVEDVLIQDIEGAEPVASGDGPFATA